jgi:hypothetical protein
VPIKAALAARTGWRVELGAEVTAAPDFLVSMHIVRAFYRQP